PRPRRRGRGGAARDRPEQHAGAGGGPGAAGGRRRVAAGRGGAPLMPEAVIKVGGSLANDPGLPRLLETLADLAAAGRRLVVIPGGGPFADAVRAACAAHDPGPGAAHWMAILAMDQYAHLLAACTPGAALVVEPEEIAGVLAAGRTAVLAPYAWLRAADPLPHGWDVTSDSIAAWVAA